MWTYNLNPTLLDLGPVEIRWYGLVYVFGFLAAAWWLQQAQKQGKISLSKEEIWDLIFYLMIGVIAGSRVFMIFWDPQNFLFHPLNLLKIWQGGMSFHGGFVGIIVACWLFCRKKQLNFATVADIIAVPGILALALGRMANFVNGELVGRVWNGRWCVIIPDYGPECRHPNMIYSFFQRMAVFGWLFWLSWKKEFKPGFIFWNFVFWEGLGRIMVDFFRENVLFLGLSMGQWMSLVMVGGALIVFKKLYAEEWKRILVSKRKS